MFYKQKWNKTFNEIWFFVWRLMPTIWKKDSPASSCLFVKGNCVLCFFFCVPLILSLVSHCFGCDNLISTPYTTNCSCSAIAFIQPNASRGNRKPTKLSKIYITNICFRLNSISVIFFSHCHCFFISNVPYRSISFITAVHWCRQRRVSSNENKN